MANNEQFLLDRGVHGKIGSVNSGLWIMGGRIAIPAAPTARRNHKAVALGNWYSTAPIVTLGNYTANNNPLTVRMLGLNATGFEVHVLSSTLNGKANTSYLKYACYVNWISLGVSYVQLSSD